MLNEAIIKEIEETVGYRFQNKGLLMQAFTRSSYSNENRGVPHNEVLELIGDSVLSLTVLTYFKNTYARVTEKGLLTDWNEGKLSELKHALVRKSQLADCMDRLGLAKHLRMSRGDHSVGIAAEASVKEDLFESIVGAVYLDSGEDFSRTAEIVRQMLDIDALVRVGSQNVHLSYQNDLQEWCQHKRRKLDLPSYSEPIQVGNRFLVRVEVSKIGRAAQAEGKNVREAKELAAKALLDELSALPKDAYYDVFKTETVNYVGQLQEAAQKQGGGLPTYRDGADEILSDNSHRFSVICAYGDLRAEGFGLSKKEAKREAAKAMLERI
jgi:ribonuclease-3